MGAVNDYITSLDGQENLDVAEVARTLLELHNTEIAEQAQISSAKIADMQSHIDSRDSTIAAKDAELQKQQAKNWELANQIPGTPFNPNQQPETQTQENGLPDGSTITLEDLFEK